MTAAQRASLPQAEDAEELVNATIRGLHEAGLIAGMTASDRRTISKAIERACGAAPPQPVVREPWLIYLSDRADGVRGRYAIARWHIDGYREVWNLRSRCWTAVSDDVLTLDEARAILRAIVIPTATPPP